MKAEIHGIEVEGTPQEIAEVIKLVGEIKQTGPTMKNPLRDATPSPFPFPYPDPTNPLLWPKWQVDTNGTIPNGTIIWYIAK